MASSSTLRVLLTAEDQATAKIKALKKETDSLAGVVMRNHRQIGIAMTAFGASVTAAAGMSVKAATQVAQTRGAFESLSKQAGESSKEILAALKKASAGTVTENDLMLAANRSMVLGVAKNTKQFSELMEIARDRARAMGSTTTQAFNDIVTGIGRGSPLILDNLGIIVNLTEANEEYAKVLGKSTSELSEAEKQQALLNAVLKQGQSSIDRNAMSTMTASETLQALKASISDTAAQMGMALLPIVVKVTSAITDAITKFREWAERNKTLSDAVVISGSAVGVLATAIGPLLIMLPTLIKGITMASSALKAFAVAAKGVNLTTLVGLISKLGPLAVIAGGAAGLGYLSDSLNKVSESAAAAHSDLQKLYTYAKSNMSSGDTRSQIQGYQDAVRALREMGDLQGSLATGLEGLNLQNIYKGLDPSAFARLRSEVEFTQKALEDMGAVATSTADQMRADLEGQITAGLDAATARLGEFESGLSSAKAAQDEAARSVDEWTRKYNALESEIAGINELLGLARSPNLEGMAEYEDQIFALQQQLKELDLSKLTGGISGDAYDQQRQSLEDSIRQLELMRDIEFDPLIRQLDDSADRIEGLGRYGEMAFGDLMSQLSGISDSYLPTLQTQLEETGVSMQNALDIKDACDEAVSQWETMVEDQKAAIDGLLDTMGTLKSATLETITEMESLKSAASAALQAVAAAGGATIPEIPVIPHAAGGIVTRPHIGLVGEAGPEAIIPLNKAGAIGGNVTVVLQGPMFLGNEADARKLADIVGSELQRKSRGGYALSR